MISWLFTIAYIIPEANPKPGSFKPVGIYTCGFCGSLDEGRSIYTPGERLFSEF
jgi:hypothetical protein